MFAPAYDTCLTLLDPETACPRVLDEFKRLSARCEEFETACRKLMDTAQNITRRCLELEQLILRERREHEAEIWAQQEQIRARESETRAEKHASDLQFLVLAGAFDRVLFAHL